jgi:hypothetical protein
MSLRHWCYTERAAQTSSTTPTPVISSHNTCGQLSGLKFPASGWFWRHVIRPTMLSPLPTWERSAPDCDRASVLLQSSHRSASAGQWAKGLAPAAGLGEMYFQVGTSNGGNDSGEITSCVTTRRAQR